MRSGNPAISVIVPAYNVSRYVVFCLESIIRQTFQDFELIVIDDASTDDTYEILQRYAHMEGVHLLRNAVNLGAGQVRNIGMKYAKGKYVFFMDSDDELLPWALEDLYKKAEEEQADVVHNHLWFAVFTEGRMLSRDFLWKSCKESDEDEEWIMRSVAEKAKYYLTGALMPMPWMNLFRKDFLEINGIEFPPMHIGEDTVFFMEICLKAHKMIRISKFLYLYRNYPNQRERTLRRLPKAIAFLPIIIEAYKKMFADFSEEELSAGLRNSFIASMVRTHLYYSVYEIMDINNVEVFATIKRYLKLICGEGAEFAAYLLILLENLSGFGMNREYGREHKISEAKQLLAEVESGKSKFARNYSYSYHELNLAVRTEDCDDDFYCRAYGCLADAALELCRHEEAVELYGKAASYAEPGSKKFMEIQGRRHEAEQYLEDGWDRKHMICCHSPVMGRESEANRCITFGTIVHYKEITDGMLRLWIEILERVPGAVLLVKAEEFAETAMMVEAGERFLAAGIDLKRLQCKGIGEDMLSEYRDIDIFLGTYPLQDIERLQNALVMGVPAVALCSPRSDARLGSLMARGGPDSFAVGSGEEYVVRAAELASSLRR